MGEIREVQVPDIGDFDEVDVTEVLVSAGDEVAAEDSLITLESDKASMEVPSPETGTVKDVKVSAGDKIGQGAVILTLEIAEGAQEGQEAEAQPESKSPEESSTEAAVEPEKKEASKPSEPQKPPSKEIDEKGFAGAHAGPAVRRLARELEVDLGRVTGSGRKGRISPDDLHGFVKKAMAQGAGGSGAAIPEVPAVDFSRFGEVEEQPLSRIRKVGGKNLHRSWLNVPHVTQHDEADITELEAFRQANKGWAKQQGTPLTPVAFLLKACAAALQEFPTFNASLAPGGESLILKKYIHIGVAVDTDDGLVVPVIRDVNRKGLLELAKDLVAVSGRARDGKLQLSDLQGGTFSISSLGGIGGTYFTPIVNAPEVAILGVSRHATRPVWQDGQFVPRLILPLSLSYDHRVIDGAAAARFTTRLGELLSDLRRMLL